MAKIKMSDFQHLSNLENRLSRLSIKSESGDVIPKDTPLGKEIETQKQALGGDLDGLPPGHPLLKMIEEAKKRHEESVNNPEPVDNRKVAKIIRKGEQVPSGMHAVSASRKSSSDEERESARVVAAHKVNRAIDKADECLLSLMREITDNEALINMEHIGKMKLYRLKRTVDAMRRLLGESKMPGARA